MTELMPGSEKQKDVRAETLRAICSAECDVCVGAGAGTGKTFTLIHKYVRHLFVWSEEDGRFTGVEQVAAITFTEKAAAEMKSKITAELAKIIANLKEHIAGITPIGDLTAAGPALADIHRPPEELLAHLVDQKQKINQGYVSTIHSFCARLLRENPVESRLDPRFTVLDEHTASNLIAEAVDEVILSRLRAGSAGTFALVEWHGYATKGPYGSSISAEVRNLLHQIRSASIRPEDIKALNVEYTQSKYWSGQMEAERLIRSVEKILEYAGNTKAKAALEEFLAVNRKQISSFDSSAINDAEQYNMLSQMDKLLTKKVGGKQIEKDFVYGAIDSAKEHLKNLQGMVLQKLSDAGADEVTAILKHVRDEYAKRKEALSALDYEDLQEIALELLNGNPELAESYRAKFRGMLVDEFQDINRLQHEIIVRIAPYGSGRLFVVGDQKQSIYGFRGSDVSIFSETRSAIELAGGKSFHLKVNSRSIAPLIAAGNSYFASYLAPEHPEKPAKFSLRFNPDEDALLADRTEGREATGLELLKIPVKNTTGELRIAEAEAIALRIAQAVAGTGKDAWIHSPSGPRSPAYGDITILFRTFTHVRLYADNLYKHGIPHYIVKGKGFYSCQEVRDIVNCLMMFANASDEISFAGVLRSPLVGISDDTLLALSTDENGKRQSVRHIFEQNRLLLSKHINAIPGAALKLEAFHSWYHDISAGREKFHVSELIERVLDDTGYISTLGGLFQGEQRIANVLKLIELARKYEARMNVREFAQELDSLVDTEPAEPVAATTDLDRNVVKLMTIHQSKGLEFPVTIIAGTGFDHFSNRGGGLRFDPEIGLGFKVHHNAEPELVASPMFGSLKEISLLRQKEESKRLFYVAFTRARDHLIIAGGSPASMNKRGGKSWWRIAESFYGEQESFSAEPGESIPESAAAKLKQSDEMLRQEEFKEKTTRISEHLESVFDRRGDIGKTTAMDLELTVSDAVTFKTCPRKYFYSRILRLRDIELLVPGKPKKKSVRQISFPASLMGSVAHAVLFKLANGIFSPKHLDHAVQREFESVALDENSETQICGRPNEFSSSKDKKELIKCITGMIKSPHWKEITAATNDGGAYFEEPFKTGIGPEASGLPDGQLTVRGKIDLYYFDANEGWVVGDYKFEKPGPHNAQKYLVQLKLYANAVMQNTKSEKISARLFFLKGAKPELMQWRFDAGELAKFRRELFADAMKICELERDYIAGMESGTGNGKHLGITSSGWKKALQAATCKTSGCTFIKLCHA